MPRVTIIGAGPAGSVAAALLARGGWDVTLIEQHRFPRDKVCGECLSALGIEVLERVGLRAPLERLSPLGLRRTILVSGDGHEVSMTLPRPMWGLSRRAMDAALACEALSAGARLRSPARMERIDRIKGDTTLYFGKIKGRVPFNSVVVRDLATNRVETHTADVVLLADGKSSLRKPRATGDLGIKAHFAGVESNCDAIVLFSLDGHYVGLAPIEGGRWNLAMSVPAAKVRRCNGDPQRVFERIVWENPGLERRMRRAKRIGGWLASALPRFAVQDRWPAGVIPIGNAAAALEPIGGEGMGLAMRSAELVANELLATDGKYDETKLRRRMRALWNVRRFACRAGGVMLSCPRVSNVMTRVVRSFAPLALRLAGKT